ncbi:bacterial alpha-L-rhamnosidase-domain-containing protein, partial [Boeremia exigua]|uniref:bacterial alpha-L-rhamnosidase-domain-containing protein n=1 Tax=Boeremia exigua TaxID=749465 RepID=UPI001E8DF786
MSVSISSVLLEHHRQAFGIAEASPRISWKFEGNAIDWEQTGYEIEITRDGVPRIFGANSSTSTLVSWPDEPLLSTESATVRARAYGSGADTDWSDVVSVEAALLDGDWAGAVPIAADRETEVNAPHKPVLFRKDFNINSTIVSARLYITGLGIYEAHINGQRVGDHVLTPGYMSYQFRHTYDTYDVTDLLESGENAIGVGLGEGWWSGRWGFQNQRNLYGDTLGVLALLTITDEDGTKQTIKSDLSWHATADGPTVASELYNGEIYDSRLEIDGWSEPSFDSSEWLGVKQLPPLKGMLTTLDGPPMRRVQTVEPQRVFQSPTGKTLVDFGQNLVGWLHFSNIEGPSGTNITIRHAEVLDEGEIGMRPLRTANAQDSFILNGKGNQTWEPSFTYHGFRFIEVNNWPNSTALDADHIKAVVVHSDMERTGYFECSDSLLNRFHENVRWSMIGNFLSVPTDCPQRDERLGWTGDAHAFMPTANYLYDASGFWRSWLKDVWSEASIGGLNVTPHIVPGVAINFGDGTDASRVPTAIWGDVIVGNPWALYRTTGDKRMLEEQYPGAQAWIDSGISRNEQGLWNRSTFQYADWLDPLSPPDDPSNATTHKHLVADSYLIQMTRLLSYMSSALDKTSEAEKYASDRQNLISAFYDAWIEPYDGLIANVTQTALTLGIRFDIFDEATRPQAASTLNSIISNNSFLVGTGFAGTQQLGFALSSINSTATFYKMLLQTKVPSWLYQVAMNGTTTWERWDSMMPNGSINAGEMTSFNHYAFGSVADWMHSKIGGLAPGEPGWKTTLVAPEPGGNIRSANATYLSPYGVVRSTWNVTSAGFALEVQVPPNAGADVVLPDGKNQTVRVGSGIHNFALEGYVLP